MNGGGDETPSEENTLIKYGSEDCYFGKLIPNNENFVKAQMYGNGSQVMKFDAAGNAIELVTFDTTLQQRLSDAIQNTFGVQANELEIIESPVSIGQTLEKVSSYQYIS